MAKTKSKKGPVRATRVIETPKPAPVFAKLGTPYRIVSEGEDSPFGIEGGMVPPKEAKYRLIYWNWVVFFAQQGEAEAFRDKKGNLTYHQREDCMIEEQPVFVRETPRNLKRRPRVRPK